MLRITDMVRSKNRFRHYWRKTAAFWEGFWRFAVAPAVVVVPWLAPILVAGPIVLWAMLLRVYMFRDLLLASERLVLNVPVRSLVETAEVSKAPDAAEHLLCIESRTGLVASPHVDRHFLGRSANRDRNSLSARDATT